MNNTRYLPESFEECGLVKTISLHFPYNLNLHYSWNAAIQDKNMKWRSSYDFVTKALRVYSCEPFSE